MHDPVIVLTAARSGRRAPLARLVSDWLLHAAHVLGWLTLFAWTAVANAGVTPEVSRVVFNGGSVEQSLQLFNVNPYPVLGQAWVDDGRIDALPQQSKAQVIALPPVFRMSAGAQTSLRLINVDTRSLPTDRESLLWLNLFEIPATPTHRAADEVSLTVTMRTQIKVFVRPDKLPYPQTELAKHLVFALRRSGNTLTLSVDNPTPYHATISMARVTVGERSAEQTMDTIAPFSSASVALDGLRDAVGDRATLQYTLIGDDGNPVVDQRDLPFADAQPPVGAT
ncbi:MAG TPA: molecular chaperone [Paraburkholderia sp.]|jgi:chaperone protein EcpD|nr:molecular chaperone [Paraburkholderia sp.]